MKRPVAVPQALLDKVYDMAADDGCGKEECPQCELAISTKIDSATEIEEDGTRWTWEEWTCWLCGELRIHRHKDGTWTRR